MKKILLAVIFSFSFLQLLVAQNFNTQLRSEYVFPYTCASIWGYVANDKEYALVGTEMGVSIVDVTDPDNLVDLFDVVHPGAQSEWRELKTFGHYLYATTEALGAGVLIIDLADLPNSVTQSTFTYTDEQSHTQSNGHTLWIDENGRLYIFGGNYGGGGATMFDLTVDPLNPPFVGEYQSHYIHDGFVRGDTLWASEIYSGQVEVVDVSNPANPVPMASWHTPNNFTHNSWPTHDNHYSFTTDEVNNSYLTSYDVSDLSNITELDRAQSNPGSGVIIHNVHLLNDQFATVAYYKDGVVIFDVSHPDNMIEVGSYDTDPGESGGEYGGTWGVYPYLPSGNIIASDLWDAGMDYGKLSVITPTYVAASWLVGNVTDSITGAPLNNVYAEMELTQNTDYTDLSGNYKTGNGIAGSYTVRFSKVGYYTKEIQNVTLSSGVETTLNVLLAPIPVFTVTGQVVDSLTNAPIEGATIFFSNAEGYEYTLTTDVNGNFNSPVSGVEYTIYAGKWGHHEYGIFNILVNANTAPIQIKLANGYYDDFALNYGWVENHSSSSGFWTRCEPIGTYEGPTQVNPENDLTGDWSDQCYVTGNGGGDYAYDDVDNGFTSLTSPVMDLTDYDAALVKFYAWFANTGGSGNPNDTLDVYLSDGSTTLLVMKITQNNFPESQWNYHEFYVNDYLSATANMQVKFKALDKNPGHVIEAAVDQFQVAGMIASEVSDVMNDGSTLTAYPNPFNDQVTVRLNKIHISSNTRLEVYDVLGNKLESHQLDAASPAIGFGKELSDGIYFVHLVENNETLGVIKIVKQQ